MRRKLTALANAWLPEGIRVHLQALDHFYNGEREVRMLKNLCPRGRAAVDAGANIGTYTYFLRRIASRVHAYEPNPGLAARLRRVFPDVHVRDVALSDRRCTVELRIPVTDGREQHELGSIADSFDTEVRTHVIEAVTLDSEGLRDVGFIKIDVEQHERAVLRGGMETIAASRPTIMTEVSPLLYEERLDRVFSFLTDIEYRGWFCFRGQFLPLTAFIPATHANPSNWGRRDAFMRGNMFFFPAEDPHARVGPG